MSKLNEYIVSAVSYEILDDLCNDIETPGGSLYIPNRAVDVANLRPMSRNTHYYLSEEEAEQIRQDPRVLSVEPMPEDIDVNPIPMFIQPGATWNKSSTNVSSHKNWGLLRVFEGQPRPNWGSDSIANQTGTVDVPVEGRNVDVIIVDGIINPLHPEYARNSDGSGGTRVNRYNWYQLNPQVTGGPVGSYDYDSIIGSGAEATNNHGAHVAGTATGNTQGWARSSTIYNIYPYGTTPSPLLIFDYIRAFHRSKPVNPVTGVRNPTIVNNSWGYAANVLINSISSVNYRGVSYPGPFTATQLANFGIIITGGATQASLSFRNTALDLDVADAIAEGIIVIGAASNNYQKIDVVGGADYNNFVVYNGINYYYNRGSSPGASSSSVCVGAVSALVNESKADFSNSGPRVDVYAPGSNIMSSLNSTSSFGGVFDPRNSSYFIGKISGTSMASPQVCGLVAGLLEVYPNMTQTQVRDYLEKLSKTNQITSTSGGPSDSTDLQGSPNRYLTYVKERPTEGSAYPKNNYKSRPTSGSVYPRTRILRFGR